MKQLKLIIILLSVTILFNCRYNGKDSFNLNGKIKGLRKGKIYLQRNINDSLISIDSINMKSKNKFTFRGNLTAPEVYWIYIKSKEYFKIPIFMEKGDINISINMDSILEAKVTGSKNHNKLIELKKMLSKFNYKKNLAYVNLLQTKNTKIKTEIKDNMTKLEKTKNLYILNFALQNKDMAISPYVIYNYLSESPKIYLDSIKKTMGEEALKSIYGKFLIQDSK